MTKQLPLTCALILSLFASGLGQNPSSARAPRQPSAPQQTEQEDVVRITTNLVQLDVVVTDRRGNQVTNLQPEDFEILEDGRPQRITNFSYISIGPPDPAQPDAAPRSEKGVPPVPPVRLRSEQVRRTIALVVDDLGLSFESVHFVKRALRKFVDEQMQPGDLVAIIRTRAGMGALQQFTSDKRLLYSAIERIKWYPLGRGGVSAFAPIQSDPIAAAGEGNEDTAAAMEEAERELTEFRTELFSVGTLGAVNYILRGLRELPGRKSILLMSDSLPIFNSDGRNERTFEALQRLIDLANRASVVIYAMDARGLQTLGFTAADDLSGRTPEQMVQALGDRSSQFFESQNGLNYLAQQTGGLFIRNTNDLAGGIQRVMDDQRGYYLIGYRPDEATFDRKTGQRKFNRWSVKLKNHPNLRVRTRSGFYGVPTEEARPSEPRTRAEQMMAALTSPFNSGGVQLKLTPLFGNDAKLGSFVRSLLHVDADDITFKEQQDGWHEATFDVLAVTYGDNGALINQVGRTYTMRMRGETYRRIMRDGFVYWLFVPVKKPGAYQLRAVLRDATSERIGSASEFIEVPDLGKKRLTLSGLVLSSYEDTAANRQAAPIAPETAAEKSEQGAEELDPLSGPAVRRFRLGTILQYGFLIYNAKLDKATGRPQLQTAVRLFRDGKLVFAGKAKPFDAANETDLKRLRAGGALQLGTDLEPGEYILQVIVTDTLAGEKHRIATQWIDLDIVK